MRYHVSMDISRRYRRKRRAVRAKKSIMVGVVALLLLASAGWGLWSSYFRVQTITIEGAADHQRVEMMVRKHFQETRRWFAPADSIFFIDTDGARESLQKEHIGISEITKQYPHTLRVVFREQVARFIWCGGDSSCYYIAHDGLIAAEAPQFSDSPLPLLTFSVPFAVFNISLGQWIVEPSVAQFLVEFIASTERQFSVGVTAIELQPRTKEVTAIPADVMEAKIFTQDDWFIFVRINDDAQRLASDLALLIKEKIPSLEKLAYIDLRFENKAFYKLR